MNEGAREICDVVTAGVGCWRDCWREMKGAASDCDADRDTWWTEKPGETTSGAPEARWSTARLSLFEMWICWVDWVVWLGAAVGTRDRWAAVERDWDCGTEAEAEADVDEGKEANWVANCEANWAEFGAAEDETTAVALFEIGTWFSLAICEFVIDGILDIVPAKDVARDSWVDMGTKIINC
jgi:hypothetical protein